MPQSQFGEATESLEQTIDQILKLVYGFREDHSKIRPGLTRLEGLAKMLDYFTLEKKGIELATETNKLEEVQCSFEGCKYSSRTHDACLLLIGGRWFCRDHQPKLKEGGVRPPGYQPPTAERDKLEVARKEALGKLSREELRHINSRV